MQSILFPFRLLSANHILYYIGKRQQSLVNLCYVCDACHSCVGLSAALTACDSRNFLYYLSCVCTLGNSLGACYTKEVALAVGYACKHGDERIVSVFQLVAGFSEAVARYA